MQRSLSLTELPRVINQCVAPAGVLVSVTASSISHIMKSTKGKEKMLAFAQYSAELFKITMSDYVKSRKVRPYPMSLKNGKNIEISMKNGRKLMRVLNFVDEITALNRLLQAWTGSDKLMSLEILSSLAGLVYYLLDNLVWCSDIGIISHTIYSLNVKWKKTKDFAAFSKSLLQMVISFVKAKRKIDFQKDLLDKIKSNASAVKKNCQNHDFIGSLLSARRQFRFRVLDVTINVLRFFMLWKSLKFPWSQHISKEFTAVCGILTCSFSLFSMLVGEEVIKIEDKTKK